MTQKDFGKFYADLSSGEKGLFTAFISVRLGDSPHSWQHKLLGWSKGVFQKRPMSPIIKSELTTIIRQELWKR